MTPVSNSDVIAIERVEMNAWIDLSAAAPAPLRAGLGIEMHRVGDGAALIVRKIDHIQFNRLTGLGLMQPADRATLDAGIAAFDKAGVKNWIVHVAPAATGLEPLCISRGLERFPRTWAKFIRGAEPIEAKTDLAVREVSADQAQAFGATAATGFEMPPVVGQWLAAIVGRPRWRSFIAYDGDTPVGTGTVYIDGKAAWLGVGATLESHRGHGAQSAILAARINAALQAGCTHITTETGIPNPGEAGPSFRNIQRAGFRIAYQRPNYRRAPGIGTAQS